ncbi:MAG: hypothetical protein MI750_15850 [Xanthomonadales bacterium]|jgi:hypothetical protein|nr:hypothetical protein [Xanthomonadales bacterium]
MNDDETKAATELLMCEVFIRLLEIARKQGITIKRMRALLPVSQLRALEQEGLSKAELMAESGYTRQWIRQILGKAITRDETNFLDRFVSNWDADKEFPDALSLNERYPSFYDLFDRYGGDFTAPALLNILKDRGIVEVDQHQVTLKRTRDVTAQPGIDMIQAASQSLCALLDTLNHNLSNGAPAFTERRIWSEYIPAKRLSALRAEVKAINESHYEALVDTFNRYQQEPGNAEQSLQAAGIGLYWFEEKRAV